MRKSQRRSRVALIVVVGGGACSDGDADARAQDAAAEAEAEAAEAEGARARAEAQETEDARQVDAYIQDFCGKVDANIAAVQAAEAATPPLSSAHRRMAARISSFSTCEPYLHAADRAAGSGRSVSRRSRRFRHDKDRRSLLSVRFTRITVESEKMGGQPCIRGMRMPVATVVAMVEDGMTTEQILDDYTNLEPEDIVEALAYAEATGPGKPRLERVLTAQEFNEMLRDAAPPTPDDVSITADGRRLDTKEAVIAFFAELEAETSAAAE